MRSTSRLFLAASLCFPLACEDPTGSDAGGSDAGRTDGAVGRDAGNVDAGLRDAGLRDASFDAAAVAPTITDTDYIDDSDPLHLNPERGMFYRFVDSTDPHTLVLELLYLGAHCDQDITWAGHRDPATSAVLDDFADELADHRTAGRKVVFRPRYDTSGTEGLVNGCGLFQADTASRMRRHVDAIALMLADFIDVIAFIEAGYLGRWGEWNHAENPPSTAPVLVDPVERRAFITHVLDAYEAAGVNRFVELRMPFFARELLDMDPTVRVGHYNDCFMTNSTDFGTYGNFESGNPSGFADAAEARAYAVTLTATAPFGGETCPTGDLTERWRTCSNMVGPPTAEPGELHMSYLHGGWAPDARSTWEADGCYDEIRRRLGYRFEIDSVEYPPNAEPDQPLTITVDVSNTGWSRLHNPRRAYIVLRSASGQYIVGGALAGYTEIPGVIVGADVAQWEPGESATLTATFAAPPAGTYELRLLLPDPDRPDLLAYAVAFASLRSASTLRDDPTGENDLGVTVTVAP